VEYSRSRPSPTPAGVEAPKAPPPADALPAVIGQALSTHVSTMKGVIGEFRRTRSISRTSIEALIQAVDGAHQIALRSQQLSRVAGGRLRQSHERLSLSTVMAQVLKDNLARLRRAGVDLRPRMRTVEIIVDPGLLIGLLEAALDWAAERGHRVTVGLEIKNWPEHALLSFKSDQHVAAAGDEQQPKPPEDSLHWYLLLQIAQSMGVMVDRFLAPDHSLLTLEFPRTVKQLEGMTAVEMDAGGESQFSAFHSESRPLAGHRLLLVTNDEKLRRELRNICDGMGLVLDTTPTVAQAVRFCELDKPHMVLIDAHLRDEKFEELREDLLRSDVNFPFVEIAKESNVVQVAGWMGDRISRISRDAMAKQLPSILVMELARIA
jgi:hypothetical protein